MQKVDLAFFMGQSNMAGRGTAALAPLVPPGMGWEYKAVSAPHCLTPMIEPFGLGEDRPGGVYEPGKKTGSLVSAFTCAFTAITRQPLVGLSCAKGGSAIGEWVPGTAYYRDAVSRAAACRRWLSRNGYQVERCFMVWCQGCTDGDLHTPPELYRAETARFLRSFMGECGVEVCFLIPIGNHRDDPALYAPIRSAQYTLAAREEKVVVVGEQFQTFASQGLMKDEFHYLQQGYDLVGAEAGTQAALWLARRP